MSARASGGVDARRTVGSFAFPFRGRGRAGRWVAGMALVALLPLTFVLVWGYAVACLRAAAEDPDAAPPPWRLNGRLLRDGAWSALQGAVVTLPFAVAGWWAAAALARVWHPLGGWFVDPAIAAVVAGCAIALPWGVVVLVLLPPTLARFAVTGRPADLAGVRAAVACVRERFVAWNLAVVLITTSWALAAIGLTVGLVGVVPGAFYAILVSAHACAALAPDPPAR